MFSLWKKKSTEEGKAASPHKPQNQSSGQLSWDKSALQALAQAVSQAPVPSMMKQRVKQELSNAAEEAARKEGKATVTAQHLMAGILSRLPANMRKKVEDAAKQGPAGLKKLQNELGK
ncbi:MAG TPA: hypothetical protein VLG69_01765 [Candidatus Andersenbacteria bacterium]|nr:hypothetical protein [Candidatus Andersenbacteria bacterium]